MRIAAFIALLSITGVASAADTVTAQKSTNLRRDKNTMSPIVAPVVKGQQIPVIKKDGKWILSESQGKQGWAAESWLKEDSGIGKGAGSLAAALSGDAQASAAGETAAMNNLEPLTMKIAKQSGQDASGIDRLVKMRENIIDSGELEQFDKDGKVGPARS